MAIGFNLPGIPGQIRGTPEEAGAVPDLSQAMIKGFRNNVENVQGYPRLLAQKLVSNQLANTINRATAKYAEPMAKTSYDQALANLQHQGLINQYYGRIQESNLRGQGLTQAHQGMINQQLGYTLERQKYYQDLWRKAIHSGLTEDQAHQVASQGTSQAFGGAQQAAAGMQAETSQLPQEPYGYTPAPMVYPQELTIEGQEGYTPASDAGIGLSYTPITRKKVEKEKSLREKLADALRQQQAGGISDFITPETQNLLFGQQQPTAMEPTLAQGYEGMSPLQIPEQSYQQQLLTSPVGEFTPAAQNLFEPGRTQGLEQMGYPLNQVQPGQTLMQQPMQQPMQQQMQQTQNYEQQLRNAGYDTTNMQPELSNMDEAYLRNPSIRGLFKQDFPNIGTKQYNDFSRNRIITTETLPSGATKTTIRSLGGAQGGAPDFKAQSPFGKANEDLRHYMSIGDLESARMAKQALDNMLNKDKKTQTEYDKSYKEWENAVDEFGPDSQKAKDYRARIESLNRGSVIRNEPRPPSNATMIYDENKNYIGYEVPKYTETQVKEKISPVGFKELFPYISEGVKPYQGTLSEVNAQIENDINNQYTDQGAANRLSNWLIAGKLLTSTASREIGMLEAPKVKNVLSSLREALGPTNLPAETLFPTLAKKYKTYEGRVNKTIQNDAQDKFGIINNIVLDKLQKAREAAEEERKFVPARKTVDLTQKISQGAKVSQTQKKSKPIKMMPNAKGELEVVNG